MRISTLLSTLLASSASLAYGRREVDEFDSPPRETVAVYLQPIASSSSSSSSSEPALLAEVEYSLPTPSYPSLYSAVSSYEAPDFLDLDDDASSSTKLLRVGTYDPATREWTSSTSVVSAENFGKGYSPHLVLSVVEGEDERSSSRVLGVSLRGVRIDAGQTRDFGPQAVVVRAEKGRQPELNRPVVLAPGGNKVAGEEVEKTFFQKYWWLLAIGAVVMMTGGGDGK